MSHQILQQKIKAFKHTVLTFYKNNKRAFPWRETTDSYRILVSEIMLQQTQTDRVVPKYLKFLEKFPTITHLSQASFAQVYANWQGLGYNRRAKFLKQLAKKVVADHNGLIPETEEELQTLPGIGPYTAAAVVAFAFNKPSTVIETNIRTVFIHHFFKTQEKVPDSVLLPIIKQSLDPIDPRQWYWALMDYGAHLKKQFPNPSRKSKHFTKQSKFEGSNRQVRGMILKLLLLNAQTKIELLAQVPRDQELTQKILAELILEGLVKENNNILKLSE